MLGIILFVLLIAVGFFLIAFLLEVAVILFVGFLYIVLWQDGLFGQSIVVIVGLAVLIATFPKNKH